MLDTYELNKGTRTMVFHTGQDEDGSCVIGQGTCDWGFGSGEGGYHYSMFALVKGLSQYISPNLNDPTNFYAKAVDLLLGQQGSDGSWPADLRDDASVIAATGFSILALGKVGIPVFPITAKGTSISSTEGRSFSGTVATFTVPSTTPTPADYTASINWGDGTTSAGTITGSAGNFTVTGTHTYAEEGSYTATVTITDVNTTSNTGTAKTSAAIGDAALHASGGHPTRSGKKVSGTVATFTDDNPGAPVSDFTATINWGDGATTSGTVTDPGGHVQRHREPHLHQDGDVRIKVSIKDDGGSTASASDTVTIPAAKPKPKPKHKPKPKPVVHGKAKLSGVPIACVLIRRSSGHRQADRVGRLVARRPPREGQDREAREEVLEPYVARSRQPPHDRQGDVRVIQPPSAKTFKRTVSGCRIVAPKFTG